MKTFLLTVLFLATPGWVFSGSNSVNQQLRCEVRMEWDNGDRPIEEGSLVAEMLLQKYRGKKRIQLEAANNQSAAQNFTLGEVQGFAAETKFVDDLLVEGENYKFRGYALVNVVGYSMVALVKGYFLGCK